MSSLQLHQNNWKEKQRNKYGTHNSPFSQNNNWKFRRKTFNKLPPPPKTHTTQPKVWSSNPSSPSHHPAPTKGPQKAHTRTLLPSLKKHKRNKTHMKSSNKWGNFPLPWKVSREGTHKSPWEGPTRVLERDPQESFFLSQFFCWSQILVLLDFGLSEKKFSTSCCF